MECGTPIMFDKNPEDIPYGDFIRIMISKDKSINNLRKSSRNYKTYLNRTRKACERYKKFIEEKGLAEEFKSWRGKR